MAITFELDRKTLQFDLRAVVELDFMYKSQAKILSLIINGTKKTTIVYLKSIKKTQKIVGADRLELLKN